MCVVVQCDSSLQYKEVQGRPVQCDSACTSHALGVVYTPTPRPPAIGAPHWDQSEGGNKKRLLITEEENQKKSPPLVPILQMAADGPSLSHRVGGAIH